MGRSLLSFEGVQNGLSGDASVWMNPFNDAIAQTEGLVLSKEKVKRL